MKEKTIVLDITAISMASREVVDSSKISYIPLLDCITHSDKLILALQILKKEAAGWKIVRFNTKGKLLNLYYEDNCGHEFLVPINLFAAELKELSLILKIGESDCSYIISINVVTHDGKKELCISCQ